MNKKLIRLSEQDFHKIIKKSVNKVLNEEYVWYGDTTPLETIYNAAEEILNSLENEDFDSHDSPATFHLYEWAKKVMEDAQYFIHSNAS